jgi:multiple sugar transport system substrate-binding protein
MRLLQRLLLGAAILASLTIILGHYSNIQASEKIKIRWATYRAAPAELQEKGKFIKDFENKNPNIQIVLEPIAWKDQITYLITAIASNTQPDIVDLTAESAALYAKLGYLLPVDDIVEEIGRNDFYPDLLEPNIFKGQTYAIPWYDTGANFWYRKDLFAEKRLKVPNTWEELLECAKVLNKEKEGLYGIVVPYGRNQWTAWYFESFMWSNGGLVFDKNLNIVFNSPQNAATLLFLKKLSKYSPPGSSEYSFEQTMNVFITGRAAITYYFGRILPEIYKRNPDLAEKIGAFMIKRKEYVQWNGMGMIGIMKGSKNEAEAKKFLRYYLTSPDFVDVLLSTPGQYLPPLKSMSASPKFISSPLFKKHSDIFNVIKAGTRGGRRMVLEHPGLPNPYAYSIEVSQVVEDTVQKVLLKGDTPESALAWAQREMERIVEEARKIDK